MKAKDTVLSDGLIEIWERFDPEKPIPLLDMLQVIALAQAEVSFKAGQDSKALELLDGIPAAIAQARKNGISEVVEPSNELLEIGRKAIEDALVEWRDDRLSEFNRGNGLVIREKDGSGSSIIRFGPETALRIGMKAIGQAIAPAEGK